MSTAGTRDGLTLRVYIDEFQSGNLKAGERVCKNRRTRKWEDIEETGFEDVNYVYVAQKRSSGEKLYKVKGGPLQDCQEVGLNFILAWQVLGS